MYIFKVGVEGLNQVAACGLPGCVVQPMATFVNYIHTIKITVIWAGRYVTYCDFYMHVLQPVYNDSCGPLPETVGCLQHKCCFSCI